MAESIGIMLRWAWLTICAILLIWTAALGYLLLDERDRLHAAQAELAVARGACKSDRRAEGRPQGSRLHTVVATFPIEEQGKPDKGEGDET